jgi:hypothetical protein
MYNAGADVLISGHNHIYERFYPQDPTGNADPSRSIRDFVVTATRWCRLSVRAVTPALELP